MSHASRFLLLLNAVLLGPLAMGLDAGSHAESPPPNVLLISIDDLNDWTSCLGGHPQIKTPHIDRLADRGTLFANAHCQAPVCNPSRASMLTGRYPHTSGVYFLSPDLRKSPVLAHVATLPEHFANHGYKTMGVGKIFHGGDQRFFQEFGGRKQLAGPRPPAKISQPHGHPLWDWGAFPERDEQIPDYHSAKWTAKRLGEEHNKPFFLACGFFRPHVPMYVPQKWFDKYPRDQILLPKVLANDLQDVSRYAVDLTTLKHVSPTHAWMTSAGEWDHAVQAYLAATTFADHCVGMVLDALDSGPHAENTIVVLFSDHGFHLGEKNHWAKRTLWEDGTRVPLVIAAPGTTAGQTTNRPAELIDVFPTLTDLAGIAAAPDQEGQSLRPLLQDPASKWNHPAITSFGPGNYAIRSTRYRFIQYRDGSQELYDHKSDEHEWRNLANDPLMKPVLDQHAAWIPTQEHELLDGDSTGHKAFAAANAKLESK